MKNFEDKKEEIEEVEEEKKHIDDSSTSYR